MNRSFLKVASMLATAVLIATLGWAVAPSHNADAQAIEPITISVSDRALAGETTFLSEVTINPGSGDPAALQAALDYDEAALRVVQCAAQADVAACNDVDGKVLFSVAETGSWNVDVTVLTVEFEVVDPNAESALEIEVERLIDGSNQIVDGEVSNGAVSAAVAAAGNATISGEVSLPDGTAAAGITVCASDQTGSQFCSATNGWGAYQIDGLAPGAYSIRVASDIGNYDAGVLAGVGVASSDQLSGMNIALQPYSGTANAGDNNTDQDSNDQSNTGQTNGADGTEPGTHVDGALSGTVSDAQTGQAVFGAQVCAAQPLVGNGGCTYSKNDGSFLLDGLTTGNYNVTVTDSAMRFADADAQFHGVVAPQNTSGLSFELTR